MWGEPGHDLPAEAGVRRDRGGLGGQWGLGRERADRAPFTVSTLDNYEDGTYGAEPGLCIHEMGTARMGRDEATSVLNGFSQLWASPNVYVTDGACMASSSCVNPSVTYMALTARAADHAVSELNRQGGKV